MYTGGCIVTFGYSRFARLQHVRLLSYPNDMSPKQQLEMIQSRKILRQRVLERLSECQDQTDITINIESDDLPPGFSFVIWQDDDGEMERAIIEAVKNRPAITFVTLKFPQPIPISSEITFEIPGRKDS